MQYKSDRSYYAPPHGYPGQAPYYQQFPPGYGYGQPGPPIAQPFPVYPNVQQGTPGPGRPRPLDREISRSSTPGRNGRPLKSALKRTRTPDHGVGDVPLPRPMSRGRSSDGHAMHRVRTRSESRIRSFVPGAWFDYGCPVAMSMTLTCAVQIISS